MPIKHAAHKHLRQTKKRTLINRSVSNSVKEQVKLLRKGIEAKDYAKAEEALKSAIKLIDKARQKRVVHKNAAARKKSRLIKSLKAARAK